MGYCTVADAIARQRAGGPPNAARVAYGNAAGNYLECEAHGLANNAEVTVRAYTGGSLPGGLSADTTYYAIVVTPSRFRLAATPDGSPIDLSSAGSNFTFHAETPWQTYVDTASRLIDGVLPHNVTPLVEPYPEIIVTYCAELAALIALQNSAGADSNTRLEQQSLLEFLMRWAKGPSGPPIRGTARSVTSPANLAVSSSAGAVDPRGWATRGNDRLP